MNLATTSKIIGRRASLVIGAMLALTVAVAAQVQTTTDTKHGTPTKEVTVLRGEVERVSGNNVWVKMEDGQIRHFANIPDSARVTVDGKQLGVRDLQPGMKLERTTITTTTPRTVTTVQTVTGKVFHVSPPKNVILTMENGQNQQFTVPDGQKFTIDGQETDVWKLKKGMRVTATKVTEVPETVIDRERRLTGSMPPPPPPVPADTPILIASVVAAPSPAPAPATQAAPAELPKTGSPLPLIGLLGLLLTGSSVGFRLIRR
jgi:LPXTG-motif cell wall-anchored protein